MGGNDRAGAPQASEHLRDRRQGVTGASGGGRAGVTIIRISGAQSDSVLRAMLSGALPAPRLASLRILRNRDTGAAIDQALVLRFKTPASFTGEDSG